MAYAKCCGKSCIILCVSKLHFYPTFCGTFAKLVADTSGDGMEVPSGDFVDQTEDPTKESADKNKAADLSAENSSYKESAVMYIARNIAEKAAAKKAAEEALAAVKLAEEEAARKAK